MYKNALAKSRKTNEFEIDNTKDTPTFTHPSGARFRLYSKKNNIDNFFDTQTQKTAFRHDKTVNIVYPLIKNPDSQTIDSMLIIAQKEFRNQLVVQGDPEFCRLVVERADFLNIPLANPEGEIERIREEIRLQKSDLSEINNFLADSVQIDKSAAMKNAQALEKARAAERQQPDRDRDDDDEHERMR